MNLDNAIKETNLENEKKLASYHFYVPAGWINDPNGIIFFDGSYKVFYQYNPNENYWNNITIGVSESDDLLRYKTFIVALAPTKEVTGIFSGSVTTDEDGLHLIFTKHIEKENFRKESISAAFSSDGKTFSTDFKEIIKEHTLPLFDSENFRDPFIYKEKNINYLVVATKDKEENLGKVFVLKSKTLKDFEFAFEIGPLEVFGEMIECPALGKIGDYYVLTYSYIKKDKNNKEIHKSAYLILDIDFENNVYSILRCGKLDNSPDFYAQTLFATKENELALISWFNSWDYKPIEQEHNLKSCGIFTYPRILDIENGFLVQKPYKEIQKHIVKQFKYLSGTFNVPSLLKIEGKKEFKVDFVNPNKSKAFEILYYKNKLYLKAGSQIIQSIYEYNEDIILLVMLDYTSCELFINHGKETLSKRIYFESDKLSLNISKRENIDSLIVAEISLDE